MGKETVIFNALMETIGALPVADTHEHLMPEAMRLASGGDFFTVTMAQYASSDLLSAGMTVDKMQQLRSVDTPFEEKCKIFMPFWSKASNTAYSRVLKIAARDLYGVEAINEQTMPALNKAMSEASKPGLYKRILQDKCHIQYCLWDQWWVEKPAKDDFYRLALRLDNVVYINSAEDIRQLEQQFNVSITRPDALESVMEIIITNHKLCGLTAIKTALAYNRTLYFERVSRAEAELSMDRILRNRYSEQDAKVVQDFLMYSLAEKAFWHDITIQVHTGLQEGTGNLIANANPALLSHLVSTHPNTRFDMFHGGYPYGGELAAMAKMFANVYLDMAWVHAISPVYTQRFLAEWLDTVPVNKLMGFGGDYVFVEGVYGHWQIAKENIARVLAAKVADGLYTQQEAEKYAAMMLFDNPNEIFKRT